MGRGWARELLLLLCGLLLAAGAAGCSRAVEGRPAASPPAPDPLAAAVPVEPAPDARDPTAGAAASVQPSVEPVSPPSGRPTRPPATPGRPSAVEADVLADECLLDPAQLAALLGTPVRPPEQTVVRRDDGSRSSGCSVTATDDPAPLAAINVYRVRTGTPEQFVRAGAAGGRVVGLGGAGQAGKAGRVAVVLDTAAGPTLQVAGARFLVTVVVHGRAPADDAWRAAARAALARLPA